MDFANLDCVRTRGSTPQFLFLDMSELILFQGKLCSHALFPARVRFLLLDVPVSMQRDPALHQKKCSSDLLTLVK
jgi:hypothetical protein